jgi:hypothetical protein
VWTSSFLLPPLLALPRRGCELCSCGPSADALMRPCGPGSVLPAPFARSLALTPLPSLASSRMDCVRVDPSLSARTWRRRSKKLINKKIKIYIIFFGSYCLLEKRGKICSVFGFQSPRSPRSPSFAGEAARRRRVFWPSSPSHPSKLYSSLGWLNSKVPKPFFPFTLRLIDVDGF